MTKQSEVLGQKLFSSLLQQFSPLPYISIALDFIAHSLILSTIVPPWALFFKSYSLWKMLLGWFEKVPITFLYVAKWKASRSQLDHTRSFALKEYTAALRQLLADVYKFYNTSKWHTAGDTKVHFLNQNRMESFLLSHPTHPTSTSCVFFFLWSVYQERFICGLSLIFNIN